MKVLITGANGFVGHYLTESLIEKGYQVIATGKGVCRLPFQSSDLFSYEILDFTDPVATDSLFSKVKPDIIVHSGAISKPDECEADRKSAYACNVEGTQIILDAASRFGCFFLFLSTDFIFSGATGMYREDDEPGPVNYYGETKLEAESQVKAYPSGWSIVRTVLVYGKPQTGRGNLLSVVKEKLENGETYKVFNDQVRTPTYIGDLVNALVSIIKRKVNGIFHISGKDVRTPYDMACDIAEYLGLNAGLLEKVTADEFVQLAKRPPVTGFDISKARKELGYEPLTFAEGLRRSF